MRRKRHLLLLFGMMLMQALSCPGCDSPGEDASLEELAAEETPAEEEADREAAEDGQEETAEEEKSRIYVYVCGQVEYPGVYELEEGDRVFQALEAAGGLTEAAAESWLNQAEILTDGGRIYVPDREEAAAFREAGEVPETGNGGGAAGEDGKVNLNTADREELMTLSGIGETKADSILQYREEHGPFQSIEEIQQVDGIKDGTYQKIKDRITVK